MGERYKAYVGDSTKGLSRVFEPKRYKGDVLVQVWMDSRVLATLSLWLDSEGNYTRFMSEVVNDTLKSVCDHLVSSGKITMVDDTMEARELLERKYRVNLNPDGRGMKNKLHNVLLSERRKAGQMEGMRLNDRAAEVSTPMKTKSSNFDIDEAVRIFDQKVIDNRAEEAKRQIGDMKYDENGVCIQDGPSQGVINKELYDKLSAETEVVEGVKEGDEFRSKSKEELKTMEVSLKGKRGKNLKG